MLSSPEMMRLVFVATVLVAGCDLYVGQPPPKPPVCNAGAGGAQFQLRDPQTGVCETFGGGGCDPACGPCAEGATAPPSTITLNWATCNGACEQLDEQGCLVTAGCRAAYDDPNPGLGETGARTFLGCWETATWTDPGGGALEDCTALDAQACSERDDCSGVYQDQDDTSGTELGIQREFSQCIPEPPDLPPPPPPPPPACDTLDEAACTARADCDAIYTGMNCTCDESGRCTCQSETFASCQPQGGG